MSERREREPNSEGRVIVVSGPSGVGKGTLLKRLFAETDFPLVSSVSATTRSPRPGEENGVHYWFLTRDEFLARRERGDFLESFEVYPGGAWYGTPRETVERAVAAGKWVVLEIDVKGARSVLEKIPDATSIFIEPPSIDSLRERLIGRGSETPEEIEKRVAQAREEIDNSSFYGYRVENDDLDVALAETIEILKRDAARRGDAKNANQSTERA
ncbi:MAG: guanylate kinase [Thermoguttaceae bacterium]|nr:guanylate kinase [Thermoguttaceae bacterium]